LGNDEAKKNNFYDKANAFLESLEPRLSKSKWLVGDKINMVDFWIGAFCCDHVENIANQEKSARFAATVNKCPGLKRYIAEFKQENELWLNERPKLGM
jgi:glutathione S-transferase